MYRHVAVADVKVVGHYQGARLLSGVSARSQLSNKNAREADFRRLVGLRTSESDVITPLFAALALPHVNLGSNVNYRSDQYVRPHMFKCVTSHCGSSQRITFISRRRSGGSYELE